jgi:polyphosphate glucokinase
MAKKGLEVLGIDIGTDEIKGCIVDTEHGKFSSEIKTVKIKSTSTHKVISAIHKLVSKEFNWDGPIGCAIPEAVTKGVSLSSRRLDSSWEATDAQHLISEITGSEVGVINDADACGIAELKFGAGRDQSGVIIVLTVGKGIGSAIFSDGKLFPNTELGMMEIRGITAQQRASNKSRKEEGLGRKAWAKRIEFVLEAYEQMFHPDLFILGGQISKKAEKTLPHIKINTPIVGASLENEATLVGAAVYAADLMQGQKVFYM